MSKTKKRMLTGFIILLVLAAGTAVYAAPTSVKLTAYQGIKIFYNGTQLTGTDQPYLINNRAYVPLRLLMENFGKNIGWDAAGNQVIISDNGSSVNQISQLESELATLQKKNNELQNTVASLNAKIATYEDEGSGEDLSDIKSAVADYFDDAGDDYFNDDGIDFTFSLSGDEDEISYTVRMDFDDANDYNDLTEVSQGDIEDFLDDVESRISSEAEDTDYEDADIVGKLVDSGDTSNYVRSEDGDYTYSWDEDDSSISDIEEAVADYFDDYGSNYFDDANVNMYVSLSGDADDIEYEITIDCSGSAYADISEIGSSTIRTVMNAVKSKIINETDGTSFEDADITGAATDADDSSIYAVYNGSTYFYSWD